IAEWPADRRSRRLGVAGFGRSVAGRRLSGGRDRHSIGRTLPIAAHANDIIRRRRVVSVRRFARHAGWRGRQQRGDLDKLWFGGVARALVSAGTARIYL